MAVSYNGLWKQLEIKNMSPKDLVTHCNFSPNIITKMRQGEYIPLIAIDRICALLGCDYGDVISRRMDNRALPPIANEEEYLYAMEKIREALKFYMREFNQSVYQIHEGSSLSVNTLKSFLNGKPIHSLSYLKLLQLGEPFTIILDKKLEEFNRDRFGTSRVEVREFEQNKIMKVSYVIYINLIRQIPEGRLTRSEDIAAYVAKKMGVSSVEFEITQKIIVWKNLPNLREHIPYWREVSKLGRLQDTLHCSKALQEVMLKKEGHTILQCKGNGFSLKVENYKDYLFDFDKELKVSFDRLKSMDF